MKEARLRVYDGFTELYAREFQRVFAAVYLFCRDRALAEDAVQEAFGRALVRWRRLQDKPWAAGWVTTTALNVARRSLRSSGTRQGYLSEENPEDVDLTVDVWLAIRRLTPQQQEAVVLFYRFDLPIAEVARAMKRPEGTVRSLLTRARQALRSELKGEIDAGRE